MTEKYVMIYLIIGFIIEALTWHFYPPEKRDRCSKGWELVFCSIIMVLVWPTIFWFYAKEIFKRK